MARLASQEKALYVPTPVSQIELLTTHHIRSYAKNGKIFDPCCGEGTAAFTLGKALGKEWKVYGVELDLQRAAAAAGLLGQDNVIQGAYQDIHTEGQCDILFLNPPYDDDHTSGERMELQFLRWSTPALRHDGTLIYVVKNRFIGNGDYSEKLQKDLKRHGYSGIRIFRFTDPEYQDYHQVILVAKKGIPGHGYVSSDEMQLLGEVGWLPYQSNMKYRYFVQVAGTEGEMRLIKKVKASKRPLFEQNENIFQNIIGDPGVVNELVPLTPLKETNAVLVACSGLLNDTIIDGRVIKGSTFKHEIIEDKKDREDGGTEWTKVEKSPTRFSVLDMDTATISTIDEVNNAEEYTSFLIQNAGQFVASCRQNYPALYRPEIDRIHFSHIAPPKILPGRENVRGALPQQEENMSAILSGLKRHKGINLIAQMGTGKTLQSIGTMYTWLTKNKWLNKKIIVLIPSSPGDLAGKWVDEIKVVLRDHPEVWAVHVETITDVQKAFERPGIGFIVIREYQAKADSPWLTVEPPAKKKKYKLSPEWDEATQTRKERSYIVKEHYCPRCLRSITQDEMDVIAGNIFKENEAKDTGKEPYSAKGRTMPMCGDLYDKDTGDKVSIGCGEAFYTKVKPKYPLARYIRQHYARQYCLIADEAHEFKAADSNRGYAANDLMVGAVSAIQMTGTFFNGKASGVFWLLYRSSPEFRKLFEFGDESKFIDKYGMKAVTFKTVQDKSYSGYSGYKTVQGQVREAPGLHPSLAALILPNTVFMSKYDLDFDLAPYSEHTLYVDPDEEAYEPYDSYIETLKEEARQAMAEFSKEGMKKATSLNSFRMYAANGLLDRPDKAEHFEYQGDVIASYIPAEKPADYMYPKEIALCRLILREKSRGRKCLVYIHQMDKRDPSGRILEALGRYGLKGAVMRANVKQRLAYIREAITNGADFILTNHTLVKVGIDIVETPTIIWYSLEKQMNTLDVPQANERPHRIHQTEAVEVYYLAYNDSVQAETAQYIAKKVGVMQRFQGDIQTGLAALENTADMIDDMQKAVVDDRPHFESDLDLIDLPELPDISRQIVIASKPTSKPKAMPKPITRRQVELGVAATQLSLF